jgi:hypothetical protein
VVLILVEVSHISLAKLPLTAQGRETFDERIFKRRTRMAGPGRHKRSLPILTERRQVDDLVELLQRESAKLVDEGRQL